MDPDFLFTASHLFLQVLYELQKKEKTAVKQKLAAVKASAPKEVRIGCQIAEHDLGVKMAQVGAGMGSCLCSWGGLLGERC
jgi:hypothetical protein